MIGKVLALIFVIATFSLEFSLAQKAEALPGCHQKEHKPHGTFNGSQTTDNYNDCLDLCKANPSCTHFSFGVRHKICIMFKEGNGTDNSTDGYYSGHRDCPHFQVIMGKSESLLLKLLP